MLAAGQSASMVPERDSLIALRLAAFNQPRLMATSVLLFAGYAPLHHRALARYAA